MSLLDGARGNPQQQLRARLAAAEARANDLPARFTGRLPSKLVERIVQTAHGFTVSNVVRHNGTTWVKSQADTPANAHVQGIVIAVPHANAFAIALPGSYVRGLSGLTAGLNFVSSTTAGLLTTTAPTHMRPAFFAHSATAGMLLADGPVCTVSVSDPGTTAAADGDLWFKY